MKSHFSLILWIVFAISNSSIFAQNATQRSTNPRADTLLQQATIAQRQQNFTAAALYYQDHILLVGESPRALRSAAQCLWSAFPQNLDSLRKAQTFMQRYTASGGKEPSAQGISRNIEQQILVMLSDSTQRAQAALAALAQRQADSLARWRADSTDRYWSVMKERLEYLRLRRGTILNLIGSGGLYFQRTITNFFAPSTYTSAMPFVDLNAEAHYAHWFSKVEDGDAGLQLDYGIGAHQFNIPSNAVSELDFDIITMGNFWANLRVNIAEIGIGTLSVGAAYRHEWGLYYNLSAEQQNDTNNRLLVNMLGGNVAIEPALGRYGFTANVRYFPRAFSFGKTAANTSVDAWNASVGYQFPKFGVALEAWLTQRTHTGLLPNFAHNTVRLRLFFEIYQTREYKWW
jgi:hypothetical protein